MEQSVQGRIHSVETFGAVDGPGVRFVVFFQGCPLRCKFCHNPDTWNPAEGKPVTAKELAGQIASYKNFIKDGGVTLSGGCLLYTSPPLNAFALITPRSTTPGITTTA